MRIGFDAKWFFRGNPSGRTIVRNILTSWLTNHPEHDFVVFLRKKDRNESFPFQQKNVTPCHIGGFTNLVANTLVLPKAAKSFQLDVAVFFNFCPWSAPCKKIVFINDVIFLEHPEYFTRKEKLYFAPIRFLAPRAEKICTISNWEKQRMIRCHLAAENRIQVVHLGVSDEFRPLASHDPVVIQGIKSKYHLPDRFLLYVGRLNERKNILNLLRAVRLLENKTLPLVLAGSVDWKMFDLRQKIAELALQDRVILTGPVPDDDLPGIYALASLFVYVSFEEAFGLPPLEAMASGIPVVVSGRGSLPEICGDAGNYVNPEDPQEIAGKIAELLANPGLGEGKKNLGLARAGQFTWRAAAENLLETCLGMGK